MRLPRRIAALALTFALGLGLAAPALEPDAADAGRVRWRGVIEGYYGPPWSHADRMRVLRFIARHGFNTYVHAPKADPYQRMAWRLPYPAADMARFRREIAFARERGVDWVPSVSPAKATVPTATPVPESAPICFSCPEDLRAVLDKLEPFRLAGARTFMVSLDDVSRTLTDPRDVAFYGPGQRGYGRAAGDMLTNVSDALRARDPRAVRLLTVPTDYHGIDDSDYLRGLRDTLAAEVEVMWTGPRSPCCGSHPITPAAARTFGRLVGRVPAIWDNWTNNDAGFSQRPYDPPRIYLGPYRRSPSTSTVVRGAFINPMNYADANLLSLATAGDWMTDPEGYDARESWLAAVRELGGAVSESLRAFAETSYSHKLDQHNAAPTFRALAAAYLEALDAGDEWRPARSAAVAELRLVRDAEAALGTRTTLAPFVAQTRPFLRSARRAADVGLTAIDLLAAERPAVTLAVDGDGFAGRVRAVDPARVDVLRARLQASAPGLETDPHVTFGNRDYFVKTPPVRGRPRNAMSTFIADVGLRDAAWRVGAPFAGLISVRAGDRTIALAPDGSFVLDRTACGRRLRVRDGAGGTASVLVRGAPCRRPEPRPDPDARTTR